MCSQQVIISVAAYKQKPSVFHQFLLIYTAILPYNPFMSEKSLQSQLSILKALNSIGRSAGASRITRVLRSMGENLQPRTVRHYLKQMDRQGLTQFVSRRNGRKITPLGRKELESSNVMDRLGIASARVDDLTCRMTFDHESSKGTIIANMAVIGKRDLPRSFFHMKPVFDAGLGMGTKAALATGDRSLGNLTAPENSVIIGTICSVTVNGILLKRGIPVTSRFGGLLEIKNNQPLRFVELLEYGGTTLDPLKVFIRARMTSVKKCAETGSGIIGASFREIPSTAVESVRKIGRKLEKLGMGGIMAIGVPDHPLFGVNVTEGKTGMIVTGGLNPVAALYENAVPVESHSLESLEDIEVFDDFDAIEIRGRRKSPYID